MVILHNHKPPCVIKRDIPPTNHMFAFHAASAAARIITITIALTVLFVLHQHELISPVAVTSLCAMVSFYYGARS
ncbi:MAG: hypothetical protein KAS72_03435 [Phycisphaerales bacterium]|nr:hypothetical protein [Phycisphaerales bacterium]